MTAFSVVFVFLVSLFVLSLGSCKPSDEWGSVTLENFPTNCTLITGTVSNVPEPGLDGDDYSWTVIGSGLPAGNAPNVLEIMPVKPEYVNGSIQGTRQDGSFTFTGPASIQVIYYTGPENTDESRTFITVNNVEFSSGHAVVDVVSFFFSLPNTSGAFTLVDAEEYAGKFVAALGVTKNGKALWGFGDADSAEALKAVPIGSDGKAVIPIYLIDGTQTQPIKDYSGNSADDSLMLFWFYILDNENFDASVFQNQDNVDVLAYSGTTASAITITNGKATISANANGVIKP